MSTDWDIRCLDCGVNCGFDDANHREEEMWILIRHAPQIAGLAALARETTKRGALDVELATNLGNVDPIWFEIHKDHKLMPVDEYRRLSGQCYKSTECGHCGTSRPCTMKVNHDGPCDADVEYRAQ